MQLIIENNLKYFISVFKYSALSLLLFSTKKLATVKKTVDRNFYLYIATYRMPIQLHDGYQKFLSQ